MICYHFYVNFTLEANVFFSERIEIAKPWPPSPLELSPQGSLHCVVYQGEGERVNSQRRHQPLQGGHHQTQAQQGSQVAARPQGQGSRRCQQA